MEYEEPAIYADGSKPSYRLLKTGSNIIYTGRICKEGAADFQKAVYEVSSDAVKDVAKSWKGGPLARVPKINFSFTSGGGDLAAGVAMMDTIRELNRTQVTLTKTAKMVAAEGKDPGPAAPAPAKKAAADAVPASVDMKFSSYHEALDAAAVVPENPGAPVADGGAAAGKAAAAAVGTGPGGQLSSDGKQLRFNMDTECISKGFVGSAATFPAFACKNRVASQHTLFLLHEPAKSGVAGQTKDLKISSGNLDMAHEQSLNIYYDLSRKVFGKLCGDGNKQLLNGGKLADGLKLDDAGVKAAIEDQKKRIANTFGDNSYSVANDMKALGFVDGLV